MRILNRLLGLFRQKPVYLIASESRTFTKLGGRPNLPDELEWPRHPTDGAMSFLAQIDLTQIPVKSFLPVTGVLYFFYATPGGYSLEHADRWQVLYWPGPRDGLQECSLPPDFAGTVHGQRFLRLSREFEPVKPARRLHITTPDRSQSIYLPVEAQWPPAHKMFGVPHWDPETDMVLDCEIIARCGHLGGIKPCPDELIEASRPAAKEWKLLLQVDTDRGVEMMWGDMGLLFFWVRESDARAGDFSKVWLTMQCY